MAYRNEFFFTDSLGETFYATAMDFRPVLVPTGWVLYTHGSDNQWHKAEAGIAYSQDAARIHAHTAKNRYIRKRDFFGKYMRELSTGERQRVNLAVVETPWKVEFFEVESKVRVNREWRSSGYDAVLIKERDARRCNKLRLSPFPKVQREEMA